MGARGPRLRYQGNKKARSRVQRPEQENKHMKCSKGPGKLEKSDSWEICP